VITYNQLLDYLAKDNGNGFVWKFKLIVSHQGPLTSDQPDYNESKYNIMIEWENGETTSEVHLVNPSKLLHRMIQ
jgi:hypothetical protein